MIPEALLPADRLIVMSPRPGDMIEAPLAVWAATIWAPLRVAEKGIAFSTSNFRIPQTFAGRAVLVTLSLILFCSIDRIRRRFAPWTLNPPADRRLPCFPTSTTKPTCARPSTSPAPPATRASIRSAASSSGRMARC
ncbi:hypothetical protein [Paenirhodobacter sp.]|uniref:hypothetical protein n=1 Tax=Paenirhodobacter sp. TaxID=1965326 RepID=UPI003B42149C